MKKYILTVLCVMCANALLAQDMKSAGKDTLRLSLSDAENLFLSNNLDLIAQKYSIDSAKATVITARLYDNPEFSISNAFYNPSNHRFFDPETSAQVSQLIKLAGKRKKSIDLAKAGIDIAQFQFYDLLRTLRYVLRSDFYNIYYQEQSAKLYQLEISSLQKMVPVFSEQVSKGYMAQVDLLRIQSQLYTLQAEYDNLQTNINDIQSELKVLIRANPSAYFTPIVSSAFDKGTLIASTDYQSLIDSAIVNRPDLQMLNANIVYSNYNLTLQKAYAKPDITLNANYDRLGGYVKDFNSIGISIPLPFFNRNQGNIKNAEIQQQVNKTQYESGIDKIKSEVTNNYITALRAEKLLQGFDPTFEESMKNLIGQVAINFQKKNLTMLEFLDYYDSYKQNVLQINQLRFNKMNALEQLNLSIGKIIF